MVDPEAREADIYPEGRGCPACDGTGFVSDEDIDRLRATGLNVPFSEFAATPAPDTGEDILAMTTWPGYERHQHADGSWCQRKILATPAPDTGAGHRPEWLDGVPTGWCECGEKHPHTAPDSGETLPIAHVKSMIEDSINRAYARGHRDGIECDADAGFGIGECEHVGRFAAAPASGEERLRAALTEAILNYSGPLDVSLPIHRSIRDEQRYIADALAAHLASALSGGSVDEERE